MIKQGKCFFTSEYVSAGHPDKVCDQISDDKTARVACETYITRGLVIIGGEITTRTWVDVEQIARNVIKDIGYDEAKWGFNYKTCAVVNVIGKQSPDISQGVDVGGAGDQGLMVGYAVNETSEYMPLSLVLSHQILKKIDTVRRTKKLSDLGPDAKSQVTVEYQDGKPVRVDTVVLSTQHTEAILDKSGEKLPINPSASSLPPLLRRLLVNGWIKIPKSTSIPPVNLLLVGHNPTRGLPGAKLL